MDREVARRVEQEDRRLAQSTAMALADLAPVDVVSDAGWIEAVALLAVVTEPPAGADEPVGRAEGWHYDAPASWGPQPWDFTAGEPQALGGTTFSRSSGRKGESAVAIEGSNEGDKGKPKLRFNFLRFRIKDKPVSFSGSVKGLKAVQLKATIKL